MSFTCTQYIVNKTITTMLWNYVASQQIFVIACVIIMGTWLLLLLSHYKAGFFYFLKFLKYLSLQKQIVYTHLFSLARSLSLSHCISCLLIFTHMFTYVWCLQYKSSNKSWEERVFFSCIVCMKSCVGLYIFNVIKHSTVITADCYIVVFLAFLCVP